jgi:hypothetical protein
MPARRWDQGGQAIEQFESGVSISVTLPLGPGLTLSRTSVSDQLLRIDFTQPFQRKGRPSAIA